MESKAVTLESLGINTKAKEPTSRWIDQKSILVSTPKSGKTSLLAQGGEKSWFIRMAAEFNNVRTFGADCTSFDEVHNEIGKLRQCVRAGLFNWETLVFDPADRLLDFISESVCEKYHSDALGSIPHGKGWSDYKNGIRNLCYSLEDIPAHKFFVFHSVRIELPETGQEHEKNPKTYTKEVVDLSERTESTFKRWVDNILHIKTGYVGKQEARTIITRGTKYLEAGSKALCLQDKPQINWEASDEATYRKLRGFFT